MRFNYEGTDKTLIKIYNAVNGGEYDFLDSNKHLGNNIIILGLGGSYAYGTNIETSDIDIRGAAINSKKEILLGRDFEQVVNNTTDTTIYSFKKLVELLCNCNPNTIELLGLKPEHYLFISPIGEELLKNKKLFLSQKAVNSFGGYANQQLRRLENGSVRGKDIDIIEKHLIKTIENAGLIFKDSASDSLKLYIDKASSEGAESGLNTEIFIDVNLEHYPLRDYKETMASIGEVLKTYNKLGARNSKAKEHGKLSKHSMHLVRLYLMAIDILEKEEIVTYRENEHGLLMRIRNEEFIGSDGLPTGDFYAMVNDLEKRFEYAKRNTSLPEKPDYNAIDELVSEVNLEVIKHDGD
jgi:predicted nucleotidyltransferase